MRERQSRSVKLVLLGVVTTLVWGLFEFSPAREYVDTVKSGTPVQTSSPHRNGSPEQLSDEELREEIKRQAQKLKIEPVDAKIDPVWKAIPGYNGREVDVEATFRLARQTRGAIPWVYREIPPRVRLEDLGPQPIYRGNPNKKMVSLMINVAWGEEHLPSMLRTLREENVKATFFLDGSWLERHVDTARRIAQGGHEVSNHGYAHRNMSRLGRKEALEEILKTERLLEQHLQVQNRLFAPPSGDYDEETVRIAHELNLKTVLWTLDTVDWKKPRPDWIFRRISSRLEPGSLILMHPTEPTRQVLQRLVREIKNQGYAIGTVSDLISPKRLDEVEREINFW